MNRLIRYIAAPVLSLGLLSGCQHMPWNKDADKKTVAVAHIHPAPGATTQPAWGKTSGKVTFTQKAVDKVRVQVDLTGLPPGEHGFHIHEKSDLTAPDLSSAGPHFNPSHAKHAGPMSEMRHAGDLGNITADSSGNAKLDITISGVTLMGVGDNNILMKSVIIHAKADDLKTDPSGNSGARIAGGVIEASKQEMK